MLARLLPGFAWQLPVRPRFGATAHVAGLKRAMRVIATRRELGELDGRMLRDVGLTQEDVRVELARAPWDIGSPRPGHRPIRCGPSPLAEAWRRWRTRRMLAELDDRALRDIGASREQARTEAAKPFWQA